MPGALNLSSCEGHQIPTANMKAHQPKFQMVSWADSGGPENSYVHILIPKPVSMTLFGKRVFAGVIKGLEMRLFWVGDYLGGP